MGRCHDSDPVLASFQGSLAFLRGFSLLAARVLTSSGARQEACFPGAVETQARLPPPVFGEGDPFLPLIEPFQAPSGPNLGESWAVEGRTRLRDSRGPSSLVPQTRMGSVSPRTCECDLIWK